MLLEPWKYTEDIDEKIEDVLSAMSVEGPTSEEYPKLINSLDRLTKLRQQEAPEPEKVDEPTPEPEPPRWYQKVDWNQVLFVGGNIVGVILLARAEKEVFINPKALGLLHKPKPQPFR